jgi:PKHD-type hydroxylase
MRLETPFHVWERYFDDAFCDHVVAMGEGAETMDGAVVSDPEGNLRDSDVSWLGINDRFGRVHEGVTALVEESNKAFWNWDISEPEGLQYTCYGPGQHYDWHSDSSAVPYGEGRRWAGTVRKISVSIHLSDSNDYDGGAFLIEDTKAIPDRAERRINTLDNARPRGSAIVFASHLHHKVQPVTRGLRRSLVGWYVGPPFR